MQNYIIVVAIFIIYNILITKNKKLVNQMIHLHFWHRIYEAFGGGKA